MRNNWSSFLKRYILVDMIILFALIRPFGIRQRIFGLGSFVRLMSDLNEKSLMKLTFHKTLPFS